MKKVELLAPAGNFDALKGAVHAGADAVYLGGERYGARAYADNFTQEEICEGIRFAHIFGRKIYLTVNTLVKEKELDGLYDFVLPFYESGLDGVIVQDLGVLRFLRTHFPELPLHASTQMTLTGSGGAELMKQEGVSRIVPARELSLEEIVAIKQDTGLEVECFIHGAMCYCYSGQCLLSSLLGGRSGNRGRCAQPCRLPYEVQGQKSCYPLSMRDMCTIDLLPRLIEAGIDSFKIEGRMKKPAYAAGVTAIYRKYIDLYYENHREDKKHYQVVEKDRKLLQSLYIRSQVGEGYYRRRNGREMLTLSSPAYSPTDQELLAAIEQNYIRKPLCHSARAEISLKAGERARLSLTLPSAGEGTEGIFVSCLGDVVQKADRQPLSEEKIREQIRKSGNSLIRIEEITVADAESVFLPVRSLNELRRKAVLSLEEKLLQREELSEKMALIDRETLPGHPPCAKEKSYKSCYPGMTGRERLHVAVLTEEQFKAALAEQPGRIYADYSLLEHMEDILKETSEERLPELYGISPCVVRKKDLGHLKKTEGLLASGLLDGVLVRNPESFAFFADRLPGERIVLDSNLYLWNREAVGFWEGRAGEFYLPTECNGREWKELLDACPDRKLKASAVVYGRLPVMITAGCLKKTFHTCRQIPGITFLKDRYGKQFPVYSDCLCCYNIIYNSVPLSLHRQISRREIFGQQRKAGEPEGYYRLDFTLENGKQTRELIRYFAGLDKVEKEEYREPFYKDYTTGHYKRGVE